MAGAAMRELYEAAAKERQVAATVKGNKSRTKAPVVAKVPPLGVDPTETVVAKVPQRLLEEMEALKQHAADAIAESKEFYEQIIEQNSGKTRDQVGKIVGVSRSSSVLCVSESSQIP